MILNTPEKVKQLKDYLARVKEVPFSNQDEPKSSIFYRLFKRIEHGDQEHRDWLLNEIEQFLREERIL